MSEQHPTSLLLIGATDTGKTHFGGQLLIRLNHGEGALAMDGIADNLAPFEEVLARLSQGRSASHTPSGTYRESTWPVRLRNISDSKTATLVWPDYAGEQVEKISTTRQITPEWRERILESDGWLLFVRVERIRLFEDILSRPRTQNGMLYQTTEKSELPDNGLSHWSGQAELVELLQFLLFVKGIGLARRVQRPALVVVLSCWDEMHLDVTDKRPDDVLRKRLPLLSSFVQANWMAESLKVVGLSALGTALDQEKPNLNFVDVGPETQGWVVLPDGVVDVDISIPISDLINMVSYEDS